ncbi:MAG: HIT family hydrolase [Bdellovibrio sp.]|nr:MAG: HIT family hydrolase [Bdellovibrio sp.]
MERDVLFRPDRLKYVRRVIKDEACVFCKTREMGVALESLCLYQSSHSMIILNKFPYNSGHVLVLPQRHVGEMLDLSMEEYTDLHVTLRKAVEAVTKVYSPGGLNLGMNLGAVAGAGIPAHLHYHVVPRWAGDLNFFPLVAETKTVIENLETSFERLLTYLKPALARENERTS